MSFWYILLILIFIVSFVMKDKKIINSKLYDVIFWIIIISLCFFAGARRNIGDTETYLNYIKILPDSLTMFFKQLQFDGDWGFTIVLFFLKKICFSIPQLELAVLSTVSIISFFTVIKKETKLLNIAFYIFICSGTYIMLMNGVRQYFVASLLFLCIPLIREKKWYIYFPIVLVLSTMHKSALIMIPVYFILNFRAWSKYTYLFLVAGALLYVAYPLYISYVISFLIESNTRYSHYASELTDVSYGANFIRLLVSFVPIALSLFSYKIAKLKQKDYDIVFNFSMLNSLFYLMGIKHYIFARFCFYFSPFSIILLCWDLEYLKDKKLYIAISYLCIIFYFIYYFYQVSIIWNIPYTFLYY